MGAAGGAQGGGLGAYAGTGGRWVQPRRGQVWPCSPATLPAQTAAPRGIDVVRAGLSPAAGSTSGGTGQAGAMPPRQPGMRGTSPQMLHPRDVCPPWFIRLGSTRPHCVHAASPDGCLSGSGIRHMPHLAGEQPGLGRPRGPEPQCHHGSLDQSLQSRAFACTSKKTSSHIRHWSYVKTVRDCGRSPPGDCPAGKYPGQGGFGDPTPCPSSGASQGIYVTPVLWPRQPHRHQGSGDALPCPSCDKQRGAP